MLMGSYRCGCCKQWLRTKRLRVAKTHGSPTRTVRTAYRNRMFLIVKQTPKKNLTPRFYFFFLDLPVLKKKKNSPCQPNPAKRRFRNTAATVATRPSPGPSPRPSGPVRARVLVPRSTRSTRLHPVLGALCAQRPRKRPGRLLKRVPKRDPRRVLKRDPRRGPKRDLRSRRRIYETFLFLQPF